MLLPTLEGCTCTCVWNGIFRFAHKSLQLPRCPGPRVVVGQPWNIGKEFDGQTAQVEVSTLPPDVSKKEPRLEPWNEWHFGEASTSGAID